MGRQGENGVPFNTATRRVYERLVAAVAPAEVLRTLSEPTLAANLHSCVTLHDLFSEARHQADLACHPYVDETHIRLAAARLCGDRKRWHELHIGLPAPWPGELLHWWRPRGRRSAARSAGIAHIQRVCYLATEKERMRSWPSESQTSPSSQKY